MNAKQLKSDPIKTVLVITVGMLVIYLITKWQWAVGASLVIGVLGLLSTYLAKMIDFLWMKLAWVLGLIVPNILLTIVFFFFLTPIALLSRLFRAKNQLALKNISDSLFLDYNKEIDRNTFEKPW